MGESNEPGRSRLIKRYANRKLYDTATSRFTTLQAIHGLLLDGVDVVVRDHPTGADRTAEVLNQILSRVKAAQRRVPDNGRIADLIRAIPLDPFSAREPEPPAAEPEDWRTSA